MYALHPIILMLDTSGLMIYPSFSYIAPNGVFYSNAHVGVRFRMYAAVLYNLGQSLTGNPDSLAMHRAFVLSCWPARSIAPFCSWSYATDWSMAYPPSSIQFTNSQWFKTGSWSVWIRKTSISYWRFKAATKFCIPVRKTVFVCAVSTPCTLTISQYGRHTYPHWMLDMLGITDRRVILRMVHCRLMGKFDDYFLVVSRFGFLPSPTRIFHKVAVRCGALANVTTPFLDFQKFFRRPLLILSVSKVCCQHVRICGARFVATLPLCARSKKNWLHLKDCPR